MARNMKTFHQIINKGEDTKNNHNTRNTTRLYTRNRPQNKFKKNQSRIIKNFKLNLNKNGTSAIHQHLQANTTSKQTFYDANHPYPMKIALIKENLRKSSTTSNHKSSITKETYQIKTPELVPIFAAR